MQPSAQTAIHTLSQLKERLSVTSLAFWVSPNIILTLAGARGMCDEVLWGKQRRLEQWKQEAAESLDTLGQIIRICADQPSIHDEGYTSYELIYLDGLAYALSRTELVAAEAKQSVLDAASPTAVYEQLVKVLKAAGTVPDMHEADEAAGHAAAGILLGYPDKAIVGAIPTWDITDPFAEPTIGADIRGCAYYNCPQPRYEYPRQLIHDPDIRAHEQLWSGILHDYYTSDFHKGLEADESFQAKLVELGLTAS